MKKMMMCAIVALAACAAFAWPLPDELVKAKPIMEELMSSRASLPPGEAADAATELAAAAKTEAARFLLLRRAVELYAKANDDDKTAAAFKKLVMDVKDVPPIVQERILLSAGRTLPVGKRAKTEALFKGVRALVWAEKELAAARRALNSTKKDAPEAHLRAGNALAVMGDWPKALDHLLGAKGKIAPVADHEINGTATANRLANAWWKAAALAENEYVKSAYRLHAAELYRKALAENLLEGLNRTLAEDRIAEVEKESANDAVAQLTLKKIDEKPLYCVIDLSGGPSASSYSVSYVSDVSEVPGGTFNADEYKTTKLVLRRIEPGTFIMGENQTDESRRVTLTKPFYIGIFEVTQKQYELVTGGNPSKFKGDMRPVEMVSRNMSRGMLEGSKWPESSAVDPESFLGRLRIRSGLVFDLPTEAQWEYACRAETTSKYNNGGDSEDDLRKLGRFVLNQKGRGYYESDENFARHNPDGKGGSLERHAVVGTYESNRWGLYDMHGNVWELCLDRWCETPSGNVTDPVGSSEGIGHALRGGSWDNAARSCSSAVRSCKNSDFRNHTVGFRAALTVAAGTYPRAARRVGGVSAYGRGGMPPPSSAMRRSHFAAWRESYKGLRFIALSSGDHYIQLQTSDSVPNVSLEYFINNGVQSNLWSDIVAGQSFGGSLNEGDEICVRAKTANKTMNGNHFVVSGDFAVSGNLDSLLCREPREAKVWVDNYCFSRLFSGSSVVDASGLIMNHAGPNCYRMMFLDCASLVHAPEALSSDQAVSGCYAWMFERCSTLKTAPKLPATSLGDSCYRSMFRGCFALKTAPELPADKLNMDCYRDMFNGCSSLNEIKLGYTGDFTIECFNNWVANVAKSGTLSYSGKDTKFGTSAIPVGWTVKP